MRSSFVPTAADVMESEPVCVAPDVPVAQVRDLLLRRKLDAAVVVERGELPLGLACLADVLRLARAEPSDRHTNARDAIANATPCAYADEPLHELLATMARLGTTRIIVLDRRGSVVGLIAAGTVITALSRSRVRTSPE